MLVALEPKVLYELSVYEIYNIYSGNCIIYDLNSNGCWLKDVKKLNINIPSLYNVSYPEWDPAIVNAILGDNSNFINFVQIPLSLMSGFDVFVLVYNEATVMDSVNEIILKLIQKRYGYNYQVLTCKEDFNPNDRSAFSTPGILALDYDADRYGKLFLAQAAL